MNRLIIATILFFLIYLNIALASDTLNFNFYSSDVDGDEIYGYLILQEGKKIIVEQINDYSTERFPNGILNRTFNVNKSLEEGFYKYDFTVSDIKINDIEYFKKEFENKELRYSYTKPLPDIRVITKFYVRLNKNIDLEQKIVYSNIANKSFISFPLYDYFKKTRNCINETYYRLDLTKIENINFSLNPPIIRTVDITANGEKGFIVKCVMCDKCKIKETEGKNIFYLRIDHTEEYPEGKDIKYFLNKIYLPKKDFFNEIEFNLIHPDMAPRDEGYYKVFEYKEEFQNKKKSSSEIRIIYIYKYPLHKILPWFIVLVLAFLITSFVFEPSRNMITNTWRRFIRIIFKDREN